MNQNMIKIQGLLIYLAYFDVTCTSFSTSITTKIQLNQFYTNRLRNGRTLRRISCHGRNHSQASCEYSLTIFLCCQHHNEYSLLGSKFSTNLLFAASKCYVTIQQRGSSKCSKWPNRMGSLQW